jgi:predicted enzyme related to lactoylglutathione lyase
MAPDPEAAREFYHAVFGWDYDIGGPEFGGYATARAGSRSAAGIGGQVPGGPSMPAAWNLYFASNDLEADVARATALGAKALFPPMVVGEFGGMATCADPTGAVFSFWKAGTHIGAQVTDEPGSTTWYELSTPNAKQARDFYAALLNLTAEPMPGGLEYYTLKRGDDMQCGIMQIDPAGGAMPAMWVSYFAVADIEAAVAAVKKHGGQVMGGIDDSPFGRLAACVDPAGGAFKLIQPPTG